MSIKNLFIYLIVVIGLASCEKKEQPYPMPELPELSDSTYEEQLELGSDYKKQVFYSFKNGVVLSNEYEMWDISFTTAANQTEMWLNGGKLNLLYITDATQMNAINASFRFDAAKWKYDKTNGLAGNSALGFLENHAALGKVWIASVKGQYFKIIIKEITSTSVTLEVAQGLDATQSTTYTLEKNEDFNFVFLNLESGIVNPEPPKKDWDIVFTRYRYIYERYNPDGSDFLYGVTGVLINPFGTKGASDSTATHNYFTFTKDTLDVKYELVTNRDVIGWNWKKVDINTAKYVTLPEQVFVVKDQQDVLWKLHFLSYTNNMGENGYPKFRYERLK